MEIPFFKPGLQNSLCQDCSIDFSQALIYILALIDSKCRQSELDALKPQILRAAARSVQLKDYFQKNEAQMDKVCQIRVRGSP